MQFHAGAVRVVRDGFGPISFQVAGERGRRKRRGVYFTPWPVARRLAHSLLEHLQPSEQGLSLTLTCCDPFAGAGVLLAAWVEVAVERFVGAAGAQDATLRHRDAARRALLSGVHGCDLDPQVVGLCARVLAAGDPALERLLSPQLQAMDSLGTPLQGDHGFSRRFETVAAAGGFDVVITNPPWEKVRVNDREFFSKFIDGFSSMPRRTRDPLREQILAENAEVATEYAAYRRSIRQLKEAARQSYRTAGAGGDLDMYKLAVERGLELVVDGGLAGFVVPTGVMGDWGARRLRRMLLSEHQVVELIRMETGPELFPEIHRNLGVALLVVRKGRAGSEPAGAAASLHISAGARKLADLTSPTINEVPLSLVERATEHAMVPLVECAEDVSFLEACLAFPTLGEWPESGFKGAREIDMTNDRARFGPPGTATPLLEGKNLAPYHLDPEQRRFDVTGVEPCETIRMAWRAVADRAMKRRLIAGLVPARVALGNSLIYAQASPTAADQVRQLVWLMAFMNSRVAEAQLRLWCANNNINLFHIRSCRIPRYDDSPLARQILRGALRLTARVAAEPVRGQLSHCLGELPAPADDIRSLVDEMDRSWATLFGLSDRVRRRAVAARTASVAAWMID